MINELTLFGFKSFLERSIRLKNLTVLTGINNSGKSSVIQALLMLEKAFNNENSALLDGHGSVDDIKNPYARGHIKIATADERGSYLLSLNERNSNINYTVTLQGDFVFPEILMISANRFGPKTSIPIYNDSNKRNRIGPNGENLFQCIDYFSDTTLDPKLRHANSEGDTLLFNIRGWLTVICPNVEFKYNVSKISDSSYSTFDEHRATNVGYGLSYALPVITALLVGTLIKNSITIIENPEAHLHPKGQTEIAKLISLCAERGSQIIIETHSDHIFDGIRIAVKQGHLPNDLVQVHWFELNESKNTEVYSPNIDQAGRVDTWPSGFFDQFEINASKLI